MFVKGGIVSLWGEGFNVFEGVIVYKYSEGLYMCGGRDCMFLKRDCIFVEEGIVCLWREGFYIFEGGIAC